MRSDFCFFVDYTGVFVCVHIHTHYMKWNLHAADRCGDVEDLYVWEWRIPPF